MRTKVQDQPLPGAFALLWGREVGHELLNSEIILVWPISGELRIGQTVLLARIW